MDGVGLVRGRLRARRRVVGAGLPRLRQGRPIRRRRVPLHRAAGPVADANGVAHVGADIHADDAVADQRAFHSSAVSRTFVQADATAFAAADAGSVSGTHACSDAATYASALASADVGALCKADAVAQSPANAGAVASAGAGANAETDARAHGYAWKSDRGASLRPYAAA